MTNHEIRNKILDYIYDHQARHIRIYHDRSQDPGFSHVFLTQLVDHLQLKKKQVQTNLQWLIQQGEVEHSQFEEGIWGYGLTPKGQARISDPYNSYGDEDRKLNRRLVKTKLWKNRIWIFIIGIPLVTQAIVKFIFDFSLVQWLMSILGI